MKHKCIITSLLLLTLLLILTAVSAQDVDNNTLVEDNNNDILYSTNNNLHSFLKEDSNDPQTASQSFTDLKDKITTDLSTGTTVDLSSNYKFNEDNDTVGSIVISKANSVIDGNGITIDASGKTAIFYITGKTVTLKNINFINGNNSTGQGGAIYSSGANLTIINCNFTNNTASSGGAIGMHGADSIIDECIFINNSANSSYAGAIYSNANGIIINNSKFYSNSANNSNGGAIYKAYSLGTIDNCYFEENTAGSRGGAVYVMGNVNNITNSNFTRNKLIKLTGQDSGGGAIYSFGNIDNCIFKDNSATYGGAIFSSSTTMGTNVTNSQFINNTAENVGGAIDHYGTFSYRFPLAVNNSIFRDNYGGNYAGAIYISQHSNNSMINNSLFINNSAGNIGGAVQFKPIGGIFNSQFYNNTAYQGGAIRGENNNTFSNLTLIGNQAHHGSAIEMTNRFDIYTLYDSILLNNTAGNYTMDLPIVVDGNTANITSVFYGQDNIINAIRYQNESTLRLKNVTYWGVGGVLNTGDEEVVPVGGAENSQDGKLMYVDDREAYINTTIVVIYNNGSYISLRDDVFEDENLWSNNTILSDQTLFQNYEINGRTPFKNMKIIAQYTGPTNIYGNITLNLTDLEGGTYTAVTFHNDDEYYVHYYSEVGQFSIIKKDLPINITGENITVGEKEVLEVSLPETFSGIVTVDVYNKSYPVYVYQGYGLLVVRDLPAGNYTANVTFSGNGEYERATNTTNFTVSKFDTDITVIDLENGTVAVVLSGNATGNISLSVGEEEYQANLTNGIAYVNLVNNTPGTYNVNVNYPGNEIYSSNTGTGTATIPKLNSSISVSVDPVFVGDDAIVQVSVPEDATGDITIGIDGVNYTNSSYVDGVAVFTIPGLKAGNKTIHVEYAGDDNYLTNFTSVDLEVKKHESSVSVSAVNSTVGNATVITVTVPEDATGQVLIDVNSTPYYVNVTDGVASVEVYGLTEGDYTINATYLGDDKYLASTDNSTVSVSKVESFVSADVGNVTVGDVALINITTPVNVTGNVTVKVTDKDGNVITRNVAVDNGFGQVAIPDLAVGNYTVDLDYNGDIAYKTSSNTTTFEVKKADIKDLNVIDLGNGTVKVSVSPGDATGNITVTVDGKNYTGEIIDGIATINIDNVNPGNHNITVNYPGNTNYNPFTKNDSLVIPKIGSSISVSVDPIFVGDDAIVQVSVPEDATGDITIGIDGVNYTNSSYVDGVAVFTIPDLKAGNKTIHVEYAGDDNYLTNFTSVDLEVKKRESSVSVSAVNSTVGNATVIIVTVPEDATGQVLIDVNSTPYYVNVTDGVASVEVYGLTEGVYDINATYLGDDKYLASTDNSTVSVSKVESFVSADVGNVTVGDVALINITTPVNVTGNVTVKVTDNDGNVITRNVAVDNGFGQVAIPDLAVGNYTVDLDYNGDIAYKTSSNSTTFEVKKADIKDLNVIDLGNGTVKISVSPGDATGNLTVTVDGKNYTGEIIDGIATINIDNVNPGNHNITVNYPGNTNYNSFTKNDSAVIPKYDSPINVTIDPITVGEDAVIRVTIPENATGNITIGVGGKKYTNASYVDGVAIFTIPDLTEGNKTVTIEYAGDDNYVSNYTSTEFEVYKRYSKVVVEPVEGVTWDNVQFKARVTDHNGNPVSGGFVIFKVSGKTLKDSEGNNLKAYVDNGTATLTYNANSGWIVDYHPDVKVQAVYSGTNDVEGNRSDNNTVTIYKRNATVELSAPEDYVNGTLHIDAIVRDQNGTTVTDGYLVFKINGLVLKDKNNKDVKARVSKNGTVHVDVQLPFNYKSKEYNLTAVYSHKVYYRAEGYNTTSLKVIPTYVNATITIDDQFSKPVIAGQIYNVFNDAVLAQNVTLTIKFDGISYVKRVTIVNGTFNETLEGVLPYIGGTHTVEIVSGATDHYESVRETYTVDATPKYNVTTVITNVSRNSTTTRVQANLLDAQNKNIQKDTKIVIKLNGKTFLYNETVTNGVVDISFDTSSLSNKTYDLELISGANKYYNAGRNTTQLPTY